MISVRSLARLFASSFVFGLAACTGMMPTGADTLQSPPAFASENGALNLIITARETRDVPFGTASTRLWVYDVCRRASPDATSCASGTGRAAYGGVQLALEKGDILNIRLVNQLPPLLDAKHCAADHTLARNDTNLHTHGLIVEPHRKVNGTYGDFVFVAVRNPANTSDCPVSGSVAMHGHADAMEIGAAEYTIPVGNHPSGLFWFHPHHHGIALNQVSAGLAGAITVGRVRDECNGVAECLAAVDLSRERILILKDAQLDVGGVLQSQEDPGLCSPQPAAGEAPRQGVCGNSKGQAWFHTINGQVFPSMTVGETGDIWRLVNASGSRSYLLSVQKPGGALLPLQVLAIDGIGIDTATSLPSLQAQVGEKMRLFACSSVPGAVCTERVRMMPSARVSIRLLNDQAAPATATFRTEEYDTGAPTQGDQWPAVDLARVTLSRPSPIAAALIRLVGAPQRVLALSGALGQLSDVMMPGKPGPRPLAAAQVEASHAAPDDTGIGPSTAGRIDPALALGLRRDPFCDRDALAPGQRRRVYLGVPAGQPDGFGIATAVVDTAGHVVRSTSMQSFTGRPVVCVIAAPQGAPAKTEVWEIVNVSQEDHNFHIHQTRFWQGTAGTPSVLEDNSPIPHAADVSSCDGSVEKFRSGACRPIPVVLTIPFTQIGDFVFHCHILEHEDGGMMAAIRVVAPPREQSRL